MNDDPNHTTYLATAIGVQIGIDVRWPEFYAAWCDACNGWSGVVEEVAALAPVAYEYWKSNDVVWGTTHDQYDFLDAVAELFLESDLPLSMQAREQLIEAAYRAAAEDLST